MPALTSENLTIEAFEARMLLRRRMFARCGVSIAALNSVRGLEEVARQSVETCIACGAESRCEAWLEVARGQDGTPVFCPNRPLITTLQDDPRVRADGS